MTTKRIAVARFWFEANSFCPRLTELNQFKSREWSTGKEATDFYRKTKTEIGAVVAFAEQHPDWDVQLLRCAAASPGGPIVQAAFDFIAHDILEALSRLHRQQALDGVYLSLHGAMLCENELYPDLKLVQRVREIVGPNTVISVSFDLHANLDPRLAENAEIIVGYKTYPHIDMYETGELALTLLKRAVLGEIHPVSCIHSSGVLLPSHGMQTKQGPMQELEAVARELSKNTCVLDSTPFGGFVYADSPNTTASAVVCTDGQPEIAAELAAFLAAEIHNRAAAFMVSLPSPEEGLSQALRAIELGSKTVAVLEPADNPLSGGIGDTTGLFRALLAQRPSCRTVFAFFHDAALVDRAFSAGLGARLNMLLGGRIEPSYGEPVAFSGTVELLTDGKFANQGPMEEGLACDFGRSVVLRDENLRVIVTETCRSPNDLAWCSLHGIDLENVELFCVKAKNHFRAAFSSKLAGIIDVDSPGPAALDLRALSYRHVNRSYLLGPK